MNNDYHGPIIIGLVRVDSRLRDVGVFCMGCPEDGGLLLGQSQAFTFNQVNQLAELHLKHVAEVRERRKSQRYQH